MVVIDTGTNADVSASVLTLMFWQGFGYVPPRPDLDFFLQHCSSRLAKLLVQHPSLLLVLKANAMGVMVTACIQTFVMCTLTIYHNFWNDKSVAIENFFVACITMVYCVGLFSVHCQRRKLNDVISELGEISRQENLEYDYEKKTLKKYVVIYHKIFKYSCSFTTVFATVVIPLLTIFVMHPKRKLWDRLWYPFDNQSSPGYEVSLIYETIFLCYTLSISSTLIATVAIHFALITVLHQLMTTKFANIRTASIAALKKRTSDSKVNNKQGDEFKRKPDNIRWKMVRNSNMNESLTFVKRTDRQTRIIANYVKDFQRNKELRELEISEVMLSTLVKHVKQQVRLTKVTDEGISLLTAYFVTLVTITTCVLAAAAIMIQLDHNTGRLNVVKIGFALVFLLLYFIHCKCCDVIATEKQAVMAALYSVDWFQTTQKYKKAMLIVMTHACCLFEVKPIGYEPLNIATFGLMLSRTYSILTTLQNLL